METISILYLLGLGLFGFLWFDRARTRRVVVHVARQRRSFSVSQTKQAACADARDQWLDAHVAESVWATRRGYIYSCRSGDAQWPA